MPKVMAKPLMGIPSHGLSDTCLSVQSTSISNLWDVPWYARPPFDTASVTAQVLMDNVRRELEPGLGISRLSRDDYLRFLRLGAFFTAYVRGKQVLDPTLTLFQTLTLTLIQPNGLLLRTRTVCPPRFPGIRVSEPHTQCPCGGLAHAFGNSLSFLVLP